MQIKAIPQRGIRERIADSLRDAIIRGELRPGDSLKDVELSQMLNTSRGPVREALLQLEKESLVRNVHNRGWFVIELSPVEVLEIVSMRAALETIALRLAAVRRTPAQLAQVRRRYDKLYGLAQRDEMIDLLRADLDFHEYIWSLSGHTLLKEQLVRVSTPYFAYMQATIRRDPVPPTHFVATAEQHLWIVKYLEDPTQHRVEDVISEHFRTLDVPRWDWLVKQGAGQIAVG